MTSTETDMVTWRPSYSQDPHPFFADRRVAAPVSQTILEGVPVWLVTRCEDVRRLLADPSVSNDVRNAGAAARPAPGSKGTAGKRLPVTCSGWTPRNTRACASW